MSTESHSHDEPTHDPATRPRRRGLVGVAVAAAVVLSAGGAYFAQSMVGGDGSSAGAPAAERAEPEPLTLDGHGGPAAAKESQQPVYELTGETGEAPDRAAVYRATKTDPRTVEELASTLGVKAKPRKQGDAWVASGGRDGGGPALRVSGADTAQQGQWVFSSHSPSTDPKCEKPPQQDKPPRCPAFQGDMGTNADTSRSSDGTRTHESVDAADTSGQDPLSEQEAKEAAAPVLRVLGLEKAELEAGDATGALREVRALPKLDGLPVQGWNTSLTIDSSGEVVRGHGALTPLTKSGSYPVLDAEQTLAQLNKQRASRPEIQCLKAPCEEGKSQPTEVTRASFVLAAHSSHGKRVLVPSWNFEFGSGSKKSVHHPALAPRHLAAPSEQRSGKDGPDDGSHTDGQAPGTPAPDRSVAPAPGGLSVESYEPDHRTVWVRFWGGACSDYTVKAKETGEHVRITVSEQKREPGAPCVMVAKSMLGKVTLDKPVGDRDLVDEDGEELRER